MSRYYLPELETMPPAEWASYQDELVRRAVSYAAEETQEVAQRLSAAGVAAADVDSVADLARIPVLPKDNLPALQAQNPPFGGMVAMTAGRLKRIFMSPGPIFDPEGDRPDYWGWAAALWTAGFRQDDVVINTFAYHLTPAGAMFEEGLHALGCTVIPGGVGNSESQVAVMVQVGVTGYTGTPSFLLTLLERAHQESVHLVLRRAFLTAAPLSPSLRLILEQEHGLSVYQGYGTADAGAIAYECETHEGWHLTPGMVVEIVEPATGQPLPAGQIGEVVLTRPDEVYPLVRFGTGDLSMLDSTPCACGRTPPRLMGLFGRVGEGVKVRGLFVHPRQLAELMRHFPAVARYQAVITQDKHQDVFTLRAEAGKGETVDVEGLAAALRGALHLRVTVDMVAAGTLAEDAPPLADTRHWD
jgi:phenylacetate-CoA ligase